MSMGPERALPFADRVGAGRLLAERLARLALRQPLVLALPPGGVVVGRPVAEALDGDFDLLLARPLGHPGQPGTAIGAVVEGDPPRRVVNRNMQWAFGVAEADLEADQRIQLAAMARERQRLCGDRPVPTPSGRAVVLVDDGSSPTLILTSALTALGRAGAGHLVLAMPLLPAHAQAELRRAADDIVTLAVMERGGQTHRAYDDPPPCDAEILSLLDGSGQPPASRQEAPRQTP